MSNQPGVEQNIQLIRDYETEIFHEHNAEKIPELVSDSFTYDNPLLSEPIRGANEFAAYLRETEEAFSDFTAPFDTVVADEDVVMAEWTFTGTHDGSLEGIPPTDRRIAVPGMSRFTISDGKLDEHRSYFDTKEWLDQLGLAFPAVVLQLPKLAWRKVNRLK